MGKIFHLDVTGLDCPQPVLKTKALLESGHYGPMTVGLDSGASAVNVATYLQGQGLRTQTYRQDDQWLVLVGHAPDSPDILVWYGPGGWQAAVDEPGFLGRVSVDEPIIDLIRPVSEGAGGLAAVVSARAANRLTARAEDDAIVLAGSQYMGDGDEVLGHKLAVSFFDTLAAMSPPPGLIAFYNTGVFITTRESCIIDALHDLEIQGATVISCGASLELFNIKDQLKAGRIGNMYEIINAQRIATHVIRL